MSEKYLIPPAEAVLPDGNISMLGVGSTENLFGVERLTDLSDIDYSALNNPQVGMIYLLGYRPTPGSDKKFAFFPVKDPAANQ